MNKVFFLITCCLATIGCTSEPNDYFDGELIHNGQVILPKGKHDWGGGSQTGAVGNNGDSLLAFDFGPPSIWLAVVFGPAPDHNADSPLRSVRAVYLVDVQTPGYEETFKKLALLPDEHGELPANAYRMRGVFKNVSKLSGSFFKYKIAMTSTPQPVYQINGIRNRGERLEFHPWKALVYALFLD